MIRPVVALFASLLLPGVVLAAEFETQQGGVVQGQVIPGSTIQFLGRNVRVAEDGSFVVGVGRNEVAEQPFKIISPDGQEMVTTLAIAQREYHVQRIDGIPKAKVTAPSSEGDRIWAEVQAIRAARKIDSDLQGYNEDWQWPAQGIISGVFGSQRILGGKPKSPHSGVDVAAPKGTPIAAPASGIVRLTHPDMYYSGGTVLVDHGHGINSSFSHMSAIHVEEGQVVAQGDILGEIGSTGRATGPHLHWRVNWFDITLDPALLVPPMPSQE